MTYVEDIIEEVKAHTPRFGYNVCLFEEDEDKKLTFLQHFDTESEANEYADEFEDEVIYIYKGTEEAKETQLDVSQQKGHNIDAYIDKAEQDWKDNYASDNDEYEKLNEATEAYEIQPMLDKIVNKSLGKEEKEEDNKIEEFSLDELLRETARILAGKAGKKMGLENKANEKYYENWWTCTHDDIDDPSGYGDYECKICGLSQGDMNMAGEMKEDAINGDLQEFEYYNRWSMDLTKDGYDYIKDQYDFSATEGGQGSGKKGHQKWMVGAEGVDCETCMMVTNRDENGKCEMCGN